MHVESKGCVSAKRGNPNYIQIGLYINLTKIYFYNITCCLCCHVYILYCDIVVTAPYITCYFWFSPNTAHLSESWILYWGFTFHVACVWCSQFCFTGMYCLEDSICFVPIMNSLAIKFYWSGWEFNQLFPQCQEKG